MAEPRTRSDLGPFPFAMAVRAKVGSQPDWTPSSGDGHFTLKYQPIARAINEQLDTIVHGQYWIDRREEGSSAYVKFEFDPNSREYPELAGLAAADLRTYLMSRPDYPADQFLPCDKKSVLRVRGESWQGTHGFAEPQIDRAISLFTFVSKYLPGWTKERLPSLLKQVRGDIPDPLAELAECASSFANLAATEKEEIRKSRLGKGRFRRLLIQYWKACAVTGVMEPLALRASHIKRWCDSDNNERLNPFNGLLLAANLDALFEAGLISFSDAGRSLISAQLSLHDRELLRVDESQSLRQIDEKHRPYLAEHRVRHGFAERSD